MIGAYATELWIVDGKSYIGGVCEFVRTDKDGSFSIYGDKYWAMVADLNSAATSNWAEGRVAENCLRAVRCNTVICFWPIVSMAERIDAAAIDRGAREIWKTVAPEAWRGIARCRGLGDRGAEQAAAS